jgi:hypothetical protein
MLFLILELRGWGGAPLHGALLLYVTFTTYYLGDHIKDAAACMAEIENDVKT